MLKDLIIGSSKDHVKVMKLKENPTVQFRHDAVRGFGE